MGGSCDCRDDCASHAPDPRFRDQLAEALYDAGWVPHIAQLAVDALMPAFAAELARAQADEHPTQGDGNARRLAWFTTNELRAEVARRALDGTQ